MDLLSHLSLFLNIVEKGGLAKGGRDLGLSPASVTEKLNALESHYGTRLLNRTTRAISLTEEGRVVLETARHLVSDAVDLEARIRHGMDNLTGLIRLSAPADMGRWRIVPLIDQFMKDHPEIIVEFTITDRYLNLVENGIDVAVRLGSPNDSSLSAVKIARNYRVLCAAPSYINEHGLPQSPEELLDHNCLLMRLRSAIDRRWDIQSGSGKKTVIVSGNRVANNGELVRQWCIAGHGIALKSIWDVHNDLAAGRLVRLLPGSFVKSPHVQIIYPVQATSLPRRTRLLIDFISQSFQHEAANMNMSDSVALNSLAS